MSDLLTKLKDFVFEQERQLTNDLLSKIARSRQTTNSSSVLRSSTSEYNLKDVGAFGSSFLNPINKKDTSYKRYNAFAKKILPSSPTLGYKPWQATHRSWLMDSDYDWTRWYRQYLNWPRYSDYTYHIPKVYPISLPSDVKSIVKSTNQQCSDDDKSYPSETIKPSRYKYDPFESDTYIKSRLPSWKQYYYTQKLRSKPSNESYLEYYDPYYDFFPDAASVDSTAELLENKSTPPVEQDATKLIDDYRDAIYEDIIQNLRTKQQRPASNTFPRRKSARIRRSPSPSSLSERRNVGKFPFDGDKYDYESPSSIGNKIKLPTSVTHSPNTVDAGEASCIRRSERYNIPQSYGEYDNKDVEQQSSLLEDSGNSEPINPVRMSQDITKSYNDTYSIPTQEKSSLGECSVDDGRQNKLNETMGSENAIASFSPDSRSFASIQQSLPQCKPSIDTIAKAESTPLTNHPITDRNYYGVLSDDRSSRPSLMRRDNPRIQQILAQHQSSAEVIKKTEDVPFINHPTINHHYQETSSRDTDSRPFLIRRDSTRIQQTLPQRKPSIPSTNHYSDVLAGNNDNHPSLVRRDSTRIQQNILQRTPSVINATIRSENTPSTNHPATDQNFSRDEGRRPSLIWRDSRRISQTLPQQQPSIDAKGENTSPTNHPSLDQNYCTAYVPPVLEQANKFSTSSASLQRRKSSQFTTVEKDDSVDPNEGIIYPFEKQIKRDSSQMDLDQRVTPSLDRRSSKLISSAVVRRGSDWSLDPRPRIAQSDSLNRQQVSSDQHPPREQQLVQPYQTTDYIPEAEGRGEVYNNTDFTQPIYEQYDEGGNVDFYYNNNNNNNYQSSRYEADSEYVGDGVTSTNAVLNANYEENPHNLVYNSYEQPYYENEFSNNTYNSNMAPLDSYPQVQNYDEAFQNGTNYLIKGDPDNYEAYSSNSTGADGNTSNYAQNTFSTEYVADEDRELLEERTIKQIEPLEHVSQMNEEAVQQNEVLEPKPSGIAKDARKLSETSQSMELNASAANTNSFRDRKKSVENESRNREPISRRASKITLNSSSDDNKRSRTQLLSNDSQKRASIRPKPGENNKLKRTASTVNKSKTPVSKRS
jgi:hypothetical protein